MMVQRIHTGRILKIALACTVFILFIGYGVFEARKVIEGPEITVISPSTGGTVTDKLVTLKGTTKNVKTLTMNGRILYIDEQGNWSERLMLPPGYNIIELEGVDRFGNKTRQKIDVVHQSAS